MRRSITWILHAREIPSGRIILSLCGWILLHNNIWIKTQRGRWPSRVLRLFCSLSLSHPASALACRGKLASCEFFTKLSSETCLQQSELRPHRKQNGNMNTRSLADDFLPGGALLTPYAAFDHFYINIVWERSKTNLHSNQNWILKRVHSVCSGFYEPMHNCNHTQKMVTENHFIRCSWEYFWALILQYYCVAYMSVGGDISLGFNS